MKYFRETDHQFLLAGNRCNEITEKTGACNATGRSISKLCIPIFYVFLYILIDKYALFCISFAKWHSSATLTEGFPCFFSVVRQMPGYKLTSQRRGTVRTLPN